MKIFTTVLAVAISFSGMAQLVDGSFEGFAAGASGWNQESTNFGTPLCDASCDPNGLWVAYDGDIFAWFGGAGAGTDEIGHLGQELLIPNGTSATLKFWCQIGSYGDGDAQERVDVYMDNTLLRTISVADSSDFVEWTQVTVDVSQFTDNDSHFFGLNGWSYNGSNIFFDAFELTVDGQVQAGVSDMMNQEKAVVVYPNPADDKLFLGFSTKLSGVAVARVYDMNGRLVSTQTWNEIYNSLFSLNTAAYETGLYILEVENNGTFYQHRFSVAH